MNTFNTPIAFIFSEKGRWVVYCYSCCVPNPPNNRLSPMSLKDFRGHKQTCAKCKALIAKPIYNNWHNHASHIQENVDRYNRLYSSLNIEWSSL